MSEQKRVAFLVAGEGIEQVELTEPWKAVEQFGAKPVLVSLESGTVQAFNHAEKADTFDVDEVVADVSTDDFDMLVLPGGVFNPDNLRTNDIAVDFVRQMVASGKPVAAICHAPWILAEANVVRDREITSFKSIRTDMVNAGATWKDEALVVDGNLITSRNPGDLEEFNGAVVEALAHGSAASGADR